MNLPIYKLSVDLKHSMSELQHFMSKNTMSVFDHAMAVTASASSGMEKAETGLWLDTNGFCDDFCPWIDQVDGTVVSEAATALHKPSTANKVEGNATGSFLETISFCSNFCPWLDEEDWTVVSDAGEPATDNNVEKNTTGSLLEIISFCSDFCPWLDEDWTMHSDDTTATYKSPPDNSVEENTTEIQTQGSRRNKIHAFFRRVWKVMKKPFLRKNRNKVDPDSDPDQEPDREPDPDSEHNPDQEPGPDQEPDPDRAPDPDSEHNPDHEPVQEYNEDPDPDQEPDLVSEPDSDQERGPDQEPDPDQEYDEDPEPDREPESDPESDPGEEPDPGEARDPGEDPDREPDPGEEPDPDREPDPDQEPDLGKQPDPVEEPDPDQEPDPDEEPVPGTSGIHNTDKPHPVPKPVPRPSRPQILASRAYDDQGSLASFYELGDILGSGAFGTVRKALRKSDNKEVAIKQIENDRYVPGCSKPMIKEVEFMLMMKRPPLCKYVIEMYEWFNEPGYISIVLEYPKHSEDLRNYVRNCGKLDEHLAKCLLRQIILAVKHCFGKGIAHNDLHLGNILVNTMTLEIKLIDFGCAYKVCAQDCDRAELASTRAICCLLVYMVTGNMKTYFAAKVSCSFPLAASLTSDCRDLIDKCLRQSLTLDELLQHDWMK
ncbi:uncharacterized protein isoform X2 [Danio rerio]|uniref:Uncharacterized protein isoform X2 n=1 Tax=Danio rerio TaxID=7955 RepID=A0AC58IHB4_DANRE